MSSTESPKPAIPLSPANRQEKAKDGPVKAGPLDRFLFRGKISSPVTAENKVENSADLKSPTAVGQNLPPTTPKEPYLGKTPNKTPKPSSAIKSKREKTSKASAKKPSEKPDPEVLVPETTDCIDLISNSSSSQKVQIVEETMTQDPEDAKSSADAKRAEANLSPMDESEEDDDDALRTSFTVSDSDAKSGQENTGRSSKTSGKRSALGVTTDASASAQKKRRRLSLDEKKAREAEMERKKAEREEKRKEQERKKAELEQMKKERMEARQKKLDALKQAEIEREEKKKQAEAEKEEKRKQAEAEKEEKRKAAEREKEEKRKQKEAEKNAVEEAKKRKLEEELAKKNKAAEMFKKHFFVVQGNKDPKDEVESADNSYKSFGPWKIVQIRPNQRLAPICRLSREERAAACASFDKFVGSNEESNLFKEYRSGKRNFHRSERTFPKPESEVVALDDETHKKCIMRAKLLQFDEDIRPPYFGTWRKRTVSISGRKPFGQDTQILDYECDSAAEWEEPEDGEDIVSSSKESDEEDGDGGKSSEEEEDGFIVPHGYLSSDEEEVAREEEDNQILPPTEAKIKSRIQETYEHGFKKLSKSLRPVFFGPELVDSGRPLPIDLSQFQPIFYEPIPPDLEAILCGEIAVPDPEAEAKAKAEKEKEAKELAEKAAMADSTVPSEAPVKKSKLSKDADASGAAPSTPGQPGVKMIKKPVPEEGLPFLIRYVHGNTSGLGKLVDGFTEAFAKEPIIGCETSKRQVERQIFAIAEKLTNTEKYPRECWYVRDNFLAKYGLSDLPVPNLAFAPSPAPRKPRKLKAEKSGETGDEGVAAPGTPTPGPKTPAKPIAVVKASSGTPAPAPKTPAQPIAVVKASSGTPKATPTTPAKPIALNPFLAAKQKTPKPATGETEKTDQVVAMEQD